MLLEKSADGTAVQGAPPHRPSRLQNKPADRAGADQMPAVLRDCFFARFSARFSVKLLAAFFFSCFLLRCSFTSLLLIR
jgi:hypothetical protein